MQDLIDDINFVAKLIKMLSVVFNLLGVFLQLFVHHLLNDVWFFLLHRISTVLMHLDRQLMHVNSLASHVVHVFLIGQTLQQKKQCQLHSLLK